MNFAGYKSPLWNLDDWNHRHGRSGWSATLLCDFVDWTVLRHPEPWRQFRAEQRALREPESSG